ncbi:ectoine hydroxylase-related dioxygenase (phytanoyl-CoA dioxygenase family) [Pseudoduganella lurida]|uniref:Ectoine hydroxylase-related dioxygenase (Phytanoyl-CoA dioxygenase family) n=1 Tax=Pseudoduganella lurida TaxID=1036180 RepID=A0A562RFK9_9BURK|nr:phytanoyl-CoA dioxygenase family protein [Pseudoduganella lurida]TWI67673.1 ectoine hydroxylase-related dioxygenase (phytanoyl-CoA dioxygenase family) [Pseudoduganella lurida]
MDQQPKNDATGYDVAAIMGALYGDGFTALKGAFPREWVARLGEDIGVLFQEALRQPGGALPRGPNRFYVEVHPERLSGFVDIVSHPWVVAVCSAILGPDWKVVEAGFDVPGPGALHQPWHRDFPTPAATLTGRRLNSLAFNITTVDVTEDMGPFEIAPGTQWDDLAGGDPMFPEPALWPRYEARAQRKLAQMGDISARSALTIHRGTANQSPKSRPVFVLGVDAPDATNAAKHDLQVTRGYYDSLPEEIRRHLTCRVVDRLEFIVQEHTIEGLLMGAPPPRTMG